MAADHWAYDAVAQLAADGVIEGYGDGTYRGDQEITRYEMAQMVARAMAKNPSGADKALVDKLAAEFADELSSLGVRVANLEKKVDNVRWNGTVRYQYRSDWHKFQRTWNRFKAEMGGLMAPNKERTSAQRVTLRLEPEMQFNKHWSGHARLDYHADMKRATNVPGADDGHDRSEFTLDRIWVQGDYDNFQVMLGKLPYVTFVDNGMVFDETISGGQITAGNKVKATLTLGRANADNADRNWGKYGGVDLQDNLEYYGGHTATYTGVEVYNDRDDKITWGVGYHRFANKNYYREYYSLGQWAEGAMGQLDNSKEAANIWDISLGWKITDTLSLNGVYAWNTAANEGEDGLGMSGLRRDDLKRAWSVELDYKGADPEDKGSWGAFIAYRKLGAEAVWCPTYDAIGAGQKGWEIGVDYVPMKNFQATFKYFVGKDMAMSNPYELRFTSHAARTFFTEMNFFF